MHRNSGIKISLVVEFQVAKRYAKVYTGVDPPHAPPSLHVNRNTYLHVYQVHADRCGRSPEPPTEVAARRYPRPGVHPRPGVPPRPGVHPRGSTSPSLLSTLAPAAGEVPGAVTGTRPGFRRAQISGLTFLAVSARGRGNGKPGREQRSFPAAHFLPPAVCLGRGWPWQPSRQSHWLSDRVLLRGVETLPPAQSASSHPLCPLGRPRLCLLAFQ